MLTFTLRGFFKTALFNTTVQEYFDQFLPQFIGRYALASAKGASGRKHAGQLAEKIVSLPDMPYHIHILNGLLPTLKLLEVRFESENWTAQPLAAQFLRCFILGFTFHDLNKLADSGDLVEATEQDLTRLCNELHAERFMPNWQEWLNEIKFLALGTEYRTQIHALQQSIREFDFFHSVLGEHCHFADALASIVGFESTTKFYETICKRQLCGQNLTTLWPLSYVEVQPNTFTLISQKLLIAARAVVERRKQTILFSLRDGFVFIGEPLTQDDFSAAKAELKSDLFDVLPLTKIDFQQCDFAFLDFAPLNENILSQIIKAGYGNAYPNIRFLVLGSGESTEAIAIIRELLDRYELTALKVVAIPNSNNYAIVLTKEWDDLADDQPLLSLIALEKIKLLASKDFKEWKEDLSQNDVPFLDGKFESKGDSNGEAKYIKTTRELFQVFAKPATRLTMAAIIKAVESYANEDDFDEYVESVKRELCSKFASTSKTTDHHELDQFVDLYLNGNFERDVTGVLDLISDIPAKKEMCMFTGRPAETLYTDIKSYGIKARGFSNRSSNTLKNTDNLISSLYLVEMSLRQKELPRSFMTKKLSSDEREAVGRSNFRDSTEGNTAIYYDLGEYFVDILKQPILNVLARVFSFDCRDLSGSIALVIENYGYDFNLYGLNCAQIDESVESNFYFIMQMLKLIRNTGFRIYVTSIITPYHHHKEIFVFENCMPFVKLLGTKTSRFDKIRIDEVDERLEELNLFLQLQGASLTSFLLSYAEDKRFIFTAYGSLDEDKQTHKLRHWLNNLIYSNEETFRMSVMNDLAQIAIEMVQPKSGSTSQESWIIRDALDVLKRCFKEKRDRETTIEQIAGDLRKTLKNREYKDLSKTGVFAEALYDKLFKAEWDEKIPQPSRLRNWINQFAYLYSDKGLQAMQKRRIHEATEALTNEARPIDEDHVIDWLKAKYDAVARYEDDYRTTYKEFFEQVK